MSGPDQKNWTASDAEVARHVHHKAYRDVVVAQFGAWDEGKQDQFFDATCKTSPHEILTCDGEPCGYVGVDCNRDQISLREIVISPEFQGRGIGSKILAELIERSKSTSVPVRLGVLKLNRAAVLYRRFGFQEFARTETHILMEFRS